jgi:hypothetical protein
VRTTALFAGISLALIALAGWSLGLVFASTEERRAIWVSAGVAYVVQLITFSVARASLGRNVMAGWGIGVLVRLLALGVYALAIVKAYALAPTAALISLATFFFLSTLVEPLLLKP